MVGSYPIYLVTGSDWGKLCEQVPGDIRDGVRGIFCCSGNQLWHKGVALFSMSHSFPDDLSALARWNWSIRAGFRCVPGDMSEEAENGFAQCFSGWTQCRPCRTAQLCQA
ncbi:MAG: hypothetical protein R3D29_11000 [Nitratireductor sp.]